MDTSFYADYERFLDVLQVQSEAEREIIEHIELRAALMEDVIAADIFTAKQELGASAAVWRRQGASWDAPPGVESWAAWFVRQSGWFAR